MSAVTVSMPYFGCRETVARAVESVLAQTHRDLTLVVVNDGGDPELTWEPLAHITDPRLVRVDLAENRGRYFVDAAVLAACRTRWWTVHDADDWSEPTRLERLLGQADLAEVEVVFGGFRSHDLGGRCRDRAPKPEIIERCGPLRHVAHHTALFDVEALRSIYGPHPGYRVAFDTLMVGAAALALNWAVVDEPLYHHCHRPASLSMSRDTGMRSQLRRRVHRRRQRLWEMIAASPENAGALIAGDVTDAEQAAVNECAGRLAL